MSAHWNEFAGRAVLVAADAAGSGRACALALARAGARVAVADIEGGAAQAVAAEISAGGATAIGVRADMRDRSGMEAAVASAERELGPLRGLVVAAGAADPQPAAELTHAAWNAEIGRSLTGCFIACQIAGRRMIAQGGGAIVVLGSINAFGAQAGRLAGCTAQFALHGMVRTLALEWGRHGIRINILAPGPGEAAMSQGFDSAHIAQVVIDRTPLGRVAAAEDIGEAAAFLLSDAASFISGALLPVDGGLTAGQITRWSGADYASRRMLDRGDYGPPR